MQLTGLDQEVLTEIAASFPVEDRPFLALAERLGVGEDEVVTAVERLRDDAVIARIGAVFDSRRLAYRSTLCAMAVPRDRVGAVGSVLDAHPNVTSSYVRDDARYDLWFTIVARSNERLDAILAEIRERTGVVDVLDLPAERVFKARPDFDLAGERAMAHEPPAPPKPLQRLDEVKFTVEEKALARLLQGDLPRVKLPFAQLAETLIEDGHDVDEYWVLDRVRWWVDTEVIRRFGAELGRHGQGRTTHAVAAWACPSGRIERAGRRVALFREVSHCYQRSSAPTWPANLYATIHGRRRDEVELVAARISEAVDLAPPRLLFAVRELKKVRPTFFAEDER